MQWKSAGRPNTHSIIAKTRNSYHYAIMKLFEVSEVGYMDLLQEIKSVRKGGKTSADLPDNVAGANREGEIVAKFWDVYSSLYNFWAQRRRWSTSSR